jgi:tripartite-type tricarboxylate transporter receptor subunit TctC
MNVPVADVRDLVAQLKAMPGKYSYASAGNGTAPHFAAELFKLYSTTVLLGVPHMGAVQAVNDTIGGQTQFMFPSLFTAYPYVKAGKLRAMAIAGPRRVASLPDVPTLREAGVEGVDVTQWYGLFAPASTPGPIVERLNAALNQVLGDEEVVERMQDHGADMQGSTPGQLGSLVKSELVRWTRVVLQAHLTN